MKILYFSGLSAVLAFASLASLSHDAAAQGVRSTIDKQGKNCPSGWSNANQGRACAPNSSTSPMIYHAPRNGDCAAGYDKDTRGWCVENRSASSRSSSSSRANAQQTYGAPLAKSETRQFCPSGYVTASDGAHCVTVYEGAPAVRPLAAGGCAANEVEEWNHWCTSRETTLTRQQMENAAISDTNAIHQLTRQMGVPARQGYVTPLMHALFDGAGSAAAAPAAAAGSPTAQASASTPSTADPAACQPASGSRLGQALGGMLGRRAAAAGAVAGAAASCVN